MRILELGRILGQRQMRPVSRVVGDVLVQQSSCVGLVEDDDLVEEFPPHCPGNWNVTVGMTKKSIAVAWNMWFPRKVRHVCEGGFL